MLNSSKTTQVHLTSRVLLSIALLSFITISINLPSNSRVSFIEFKNYSIPTQKSNKEQISDLESQYVASNFAQGIKEFKNKNFQKAINYFTQCIKLKPSHHTAYMNRGLAKVQLKDFEGALKDYDKAIFLNTKLSQAYKNRGILKFKHFKDLDGALEDFDSLLVLKPKYVRGYFDRATIKILNKDLQGAIQDLNIVAELNPNFEKIIYVYWNQSQAYKKLGQSDKAKKYLDLAVKTNPKLTGQLVYQLSNNQIKNNNFDDAESNLTILIERNLDPQITSKAYFKRGSLLYYQQNYKASVLDLSKAIELKPDYQEAIVLRGLVFMRTNNYENALKDFDKALALKPNNTEVSNYRTFALKQLDQKLSKENN